MHDTMFFPRPEERFDYWKNIAVNDFPKNLIATIASRSALTRYIYSSARLIFKGQSLGLNREKVSQSTTSRWDEFNAPTK